MVNLKKNKKLKNNRVRAWAREIDGAYHATTLKKGLVPPGYYNIPCEVIFNGGWIHILDREPEQSDADFNDNVIVWEEDSITMRCWHVVDAMNCDWWQPALKAPKRKIIRYG